MIYFLKIFDSKCAANPCFQEFIQDSLLPAINNTKYFDTDDVYNAFSSFLQSFGNQGTSWGCVIDSICSLSWAPIPLFHCLRALSEASEKMNDKVSSTCFSKLYPHFMNRCIKFTFQRRFWKKVSHFQVKFCVMILSPR